MSYRGAHLKRTQRDAVGILTYWFLLFMAFSAGGWVYETVYNMVVQGGFHWRASLAGPWCPMYGIGGVLLTAMFQRWAWKRRSGFWRKAASVLVVAAGIYAVATVVELAAAFVCSAIMGYVPWDYSTSWGNFLGVVAPSFTLKFVIGGLLFVYVLTPLVERLCCRFPVGSTALAVCLAALLTVDTALEALGVWSDVIPRDPVRYDMPKVDLASELARLSR